MQWCLLSLLHHDAGIAKTTYSIILCCNCANMHWLWKNSTRPGYSLFMKSWTRTLHILPSTHTKWSTPYHIDHYIVNLKCHCYFVSGSRLYCLPCSWQLVLAHMHLLDPELITGYSWKLHCKHHHIRRNIRTILPPHVIFCIRNWKILKKLIHRLTPCKILNWYHWWQLVEVLNIINAVEKFMKKRHLVIFCEKKKFLHYSGKTV